jgi:hypothetical protein
MADGWAVKEVRTDEQGIKNSEVVETLGKEMANIKAIRHAPNFCKRLAFQTMASSPSTFLIPCSSVLTSLPWYSQSLIYASQS